jgi:hypothetical protein
VRAALLAAALLLGGCATHATLTVTMHADGTGTVAVRVGLDAEAVHAVEAGGAPLETAVRLTDLARAGWHVTRWVRAKDGSATIVITKPFQSPDQVAGIARELSGATGPLRGLTASRDAAWLGLAHTSSVRGLVDVGDVTSGVSADPGLAASLASHGVNVAAIDQVLSGQLRAGLTLRVVVDLPGGSHTLTVAPGRRAHLDASSTAPDTTRDAFAAAALALVALAILAWRRGRPRGARGRRPGPAPSPDTRRGRAPVGYRDAP